MNRMFVITPEFDKLWSEVGNDDKELRYLQNYLLNNPKSGVVIPATDGLRKIRWNLKGKGKRGGIRILYLDIEKHEVTYFISILKKNEKENLTALDKILIKKKISLIKDILDSK
jgi:mRNA-degrading endonuclease RelE of RelBE toxin-antitoxin system